MNGRVFDIQRFSIHDGPGIRTTVFLKGCPLRCVWCHNPEGLRAQPELSFVPQQCIDCRACMRACPVGAHLDRDGRHVIDRNKCRVCGACAKACCTGALEIIGRDVTVEEVLAEVLRDQAFYKTSGGGMTLSGGEPLAQAEFSLELLRAARNAGLHCCMETSCLAPRQTLAAATKHVDLFLCDVKGIDPARHRRNTGVDNTTILANVKWLHEQSAAVRVRLPLVPGLNDSADDLRAVADFLRPLPNLAPVEIMPYHRLGTGKLGHLGVAEDLQASLVEPDDARKTQWRRTLEEAGLAVVPA